MPLAGSVPAPIRARMARRDVRFLTGRSQIADLETSMRRPPQRVATHRRTGLDATVTAGITSDARLTVS